MSAKEKDWFMETILNFPIKEKNEHLFINSKPKTTKRCFMSTNYVIGFAKKSLPSKEYLTNCDLLTWDEFRRQNIINAVTGKVFYNNIYIEKIAKILEILGWGYWTVTVHFPKKVAPVMFTVDNNCDFALFIAPMTPREILLNTDESKKGL